MAIENWVQRVKYRPMVEGWNEINYRPMVESWNER